MVGYNNPIWTRRSNNNQPTRACCDQGWWMHGTLLMFHDVSSFKPLLPQMHVYMLQVLSTWDITISMNLHEFTWIYMNLHQSWASQSSSCQDSFHLSLQCSMDHCTRQSQSTCGVCEEGLPLLSSSIQSSSSSWCSWTDKITICRDGLSDVHQIQLSALRHRWGHIGPHPRALRRHETAGILWGLVEDPSQALHLPEGH